MPSSRPLLFIHYGASAYLAETLRAARLCNPDSRIVLLGDASNRRYARHGVEWVDFATLPACDEHRAFARVFVPIVGARHGKEAWVRFVFERWFFIYEFIRSAGIDAFWTFDSDTVLLRNLAHLEPLFADVDCTEQCNGMCLNGYVGSARLVQGYLRSIVDQFGRPAHLDAWRRRVEEHPDWAFTEMGAWETYRTEAALRVRHLLTPAADSVFDDAICQAHGMEMTTPAETGQPMKRIFADADGRLYVRRHDTGALYRLSSVNMSWAPPHLFRRWRGYAARGSQLPSVPDAPAVSAVPMQRTAGDRLRALMARVIP